MLFRTAEDLGFDPNQVTPGVIGFTATALVAGVIILLLFDFNRRVRRINDRADAKERLEAELAAQAAAEEAEGGFSAGEGADASARTIAGPGQADHPQPAADRDVVEAEVVEPEHVRRERSADGA